MEKVFSFISSLTSVFYEVCGYPTIKVFSDFAEVYFDVSSTIRSLKLIDLPYSDEFRMFPSDGVITLVYTFYFGSHESDEK